jgi:hypothetical protein
MPHFLFLRNLSVGTLPLKVFIFYRQKFKLKKRKEKKKREEIVKVEW